MINELSKILDKRRAELVNLLENHAQTIDIEKQHQIYGAINEIDVLMQTLQYYRAKELKEHREDIKLVGPSNESAIKRVFNKVTGVFKNK